MASGSSTGWYLRPILQVRTLPKWSFRIVSSNDPQILEAARRPSNATLVALFILVVLALAPFMHPFGGQQASRYALTAAVWDHGTLEVTEYASLLFRDGAARDGAFYSDKAPGQPLLAVPFYGIYRLVGGDPPRYGAG